MFEAQKAKPEIQVEVLMVLIQTVFASSVNTQEGILNRQTWLDV